MAPSDVLLRKLQYHSPIDSADVAAIRRLRCEIRELAAGEEFIRQGDRPKAAAIVIEGIMARYHTLAVGCAAVSCPSLSGRLAGRPGALS